MVTVHCGLWAKSMQLSPLKAELGLKVDEPKQGAGNTNDGNTARRAFQDEKTFADICGLDESLVHRFHIILIAISCKLPLDSEKFGAYCRETAELLIELYPLFRMPVQGVQECSIPKNAKF